jgi:transposase
MSLKLEGISPVPEETARIAHAAYPKGNVFMHMRDELGTIYQDESFAPLFSHTGQPAEAPWRLVLVTIMQFAEGLSDRQAADAVRGRIDWKYALGLELTDPGFDASVRSRVPHTADRGPGRRTALDGDVGRVQAARLAQSPR